MAAGNEYTLTLIRGDGIGPELVESARRCIEATGVAIKWDVVDAGMDVMEKEGTPLPGAVLDSIRRNKVALKGPVTTPLGSGFRSVNVALRRELDLFANVRPCVFYPGAYSPLRSPEKMDLVIVRENTEDLYAGIEFAEGEEDTRDIIAHLQRKSGISINEDSGVSIKTISVRATRRIVEYAFRYAKRNGRKSVTAVTKSNIMKCTDGLFMKVAGEVSHSYPEIPYNHLIIDNMCMQLVQMPELFDVIVLPNLYGDIISDLCAGLVGGLGVSPGANFGEEYAIFEATHGSAPQFKGKDQMNPAALILSGVLMLRHLGEHREADRLEHAVASVIRKGESVTCDLRPERNSPVGTAKMTESILKELEKE